MEEADAQATATALPRATSLQGALEASGSVAYTAYWHSPGHTTLQCPPFQLSATSALPVRMHACPPLIF